MKELKVKVSNLSSSWPWMTFSRTNVAGAGRAGATGQDPVPGKVSNNKYYMSDFAALTLTYVFYTSHLTPHPSLIF